MKKVLCIIILLVGVAMFLSGCVYTDGQRQSVYQGGSTALGAAVGQVLGGDTQSTLIGAGIGYVAGGLTKEFAYPRQETVVAQQHHASPSAYQQQSSYRHPPKRYSDRYIKGLRRDYYEALRIMDEYGEMAGTCSDYYFRRTSLGNYSSRYGRTYQRTRESSRGRVANDCARAKDKTAWARAIIREYNSLARQGYM